MNLLKKSIIYLEKEIPVYDIEVDNINHNYCLSNGVVVHNSKDTADGLTGSVFSCYSDMDNASKLSTKYKAESHSEAMKERANTQINQFQDMLENLY